VDTRHKVLIQFRVLVQKLGTSLTTESSRSFDGAARCNGLLHGNLMQQESLASGGLSKRKRLIFTQPIARTSAVAVQEKVQDK